MLGQHHGKREKSTWEPGDGTNCCGPLTFWNNMAITLMNPHMVMRINGHLSTFFTKKSLTFSDYQEEECCALLEWCFHVLIYKFQPHSQSSTSQTEFIKHTMHRSENRGCGLFIEKNWSCSRYWKQDLKQCGVWPKYTYTCIKEFLCHNYMELVVIIVEIKLQRCLQEAGWNNQHATSVDPKTIQFMVGNSSF